MKIRKTIITGASVAAAVGLVLANGTQAVAQTNGWGTVTDEGGVTELNIRSGPNTNSQVVGTIPANTDVGLECAVSNGEEVTGPWGNVTQLWYLIDGSDLAQPQFISDAYLLTGSDFAVTPECAQPILGATPTVQEETAPAPSGDPVGCYGIVCTDLDPNETNCADDAVTIWSANAATDENIANGYTKGYGVLEMRFSESCYSNWVRFTSWGGVGEFVASALGGGQTGGTPWIWRDGVDDAPRGPVGGPEGNAGFDPLNPESTTWTTMVSAQGTTCMSVDLYSYVDPIYEDPDHMEGSAQYYDEGNFTAGCIS